MYGIGVTAPLAIVAALEEFVKADRSETGMPYMLSDTGSGRQGPSGTLGEGDAVGDPKSPRHAVGVICFVDHDVLQSRPVGQGIVFVIVRVLGHAAKAIGSCIDESARATNSRCRRKTYSHRQNH